MNKYKIVLLFLFSFFGSAAFGALQWDIAAYLSAGTAIAVSAASMLGAAPIVVGGVLAVGVHAAVIGLYWNDVNPPKTSSGSNASKGLSVVLDPNTPLVTPQNWSAPVASADNPNLEPSPPQDENKLTPVTGSSRFPTTDTSGRNHDDICNGGTIQNYNCVLTGETVPALIAKFEQNAKLSSKYCYPYNTCSNFHQSEDEPYKVCFDETGDFGTEEMCVPFITGFGTCKPGYQLDESYNCKLSNPAIVQKPSDDICEVRIKNGVFTPMKNDPDCSNSAIQGLNTAQVSAGSSSKSTYLVTTANNDLTIYDKQFISDSNKTTASIAHINADTTVNSLQTLYASGNQVGTLPGTVNATNGNTTEGLTTGGSSGTTSTGSGSGLSASEVSNILDDKLGKVFSTSGDLPNKDSSEGTSNLSAPLVDSLNPLKNIQLPVANGVCPTATFHLFNKSFVMNQQCDLFEAHKQTFKSAFYLIYLIISIRIILSA